MIKRILAFSAFIILNNYSLFAQIQASPDTIDFNDQFHRLVNIYFINKGSQPVSIDSIYYASNINYQNNFYLTRFNRTVNNVPLINPGDTLEMDCILTGYFEVDQGDSTDTMYLSASNNLTIPIRINIRFFKEYYKGVIRGFVTNGSAPLDNTNIYFYYNGTFPFKKVITDNNGYFSTMLPIGDYTIAAEKTNYYMTFYNQQTGPFNAAKILLYENDTASVNFTLQPESNTGNTIDGFILDRVATSTVHTGYVIVRPGRHTPSKIKAGPVENDYLGAINPDGSFRINNIPSGTYLLQSFSGYYAPSYYSSSNKYSEFWQQADTIVINNNISGISINMDRDSSFGGGIIDGTITSSSANFDYSNVIIYAFSVFNSDTIIYNYAVTDSLGNFEIDRLPYGNFQLLAQKLNYPDILYPSNVFINPANETVTGINIQYMVDMVNNNKILPQSPVLYQNYPNPFNPVTIISYSIPQNEFVKLDVYDILGRRTSELVNGEKPKGEYSVEFNASGLPSGVYFYRLRAGGYMQTKKLIILK